MKAHFNGLHVFEAGQWTVVRHFLDNPLRNFNYVIINAEKEVAISIDPLDIDFLRYVLEEFHVDLGAVLITHEHSDHIEGLPKIERQFPDAKLYGPKGVEHYLIEDMHGAIEHVTGGDIIEFNGANIEVIHTPGHTKMHISFLVEDERPILISGDTIFALGVGHCKLGGDVEDLFHTINKLSQRFDDDKTIYLPGHDLLESNFGFADQFGWDSGNARAELMFEPELRPIRTVSDECRQNVFFNAYQHQIADSDTGNPETDPMTVFISLREQRDNW